ncbi:putative periplasmic lipoprotein [Wenyingzhuangia aestuarii]|uniref:hypothetical protein n=1 Tax=Wenyingzhuangia aestuarii TaxID=1647582 RepID=UPI001439A5E2|nr:hypothetical protein [Wenyingzhuangia aestuarii]NJB83757.1 hypothetical protein [Wenyingzhuangia aestuarii]
MKNLTIFSILFILLLSGCKCSKKLNYSELSQQQLINEKNNLKLSLNYIIVNSVISDIENGKNHMPLTKIDNVISNKYLKIDSRLKETVNNWKFHSSKVGEFEKEHKPQLQELGTLLRKKEISRDIYFEKNRQFRSELRNEFPKEYPRLSLNHINSLKIMWRKAGRLMIEDYKKENKEFPTNWIPKEDIAKAKSLKEYKCIENTIKKIEKKTDR